MTELLTSELVKYPNCERLARHKDLLLSLGEVMDQCNIYDRLGEQVLFSPEQVVCAVYGIDRVELEKERKAMLEEITNM